MNKDYLNKIINDDCMNHLEKLSDNSIDLFLSDIPYGISLDDWDVLHKNTNSALLGTSPAQKGISAFKRRGKPLNGWSSADKNIGKEYQEWVSTWSDKIFPKMKAGSSLFVFGARRTIHRVINSFENSGFILKDVLAWKKSSAFHRAQRASIVMKNRGLEEEAKKWDGWRLGNLAPIYEPIAWFFKSYKITITDNLLENELGAINTEICKISGSNPTNLLEFSFSRKEKKIHEAQKPISLIEFLIKLTTRESQTVLDPFMGSGTTAVAAKNLKRNYIGFEIHTEYYKDSLIRIENASYELPKSQEILSLFEHRKKYKTRQLTPNQPDVKSGKHK